jgi:hypothetical protein
MTDILAGFLGFVVLVLAVGLIFRIALAIGGF